MTLSYIERRADGLYEVGILYQDGYERSIYHERADAVRTYKSGMALLSGFQDEAEDIPDPVIRDRSRWPVGLGGSDNVFTIGGGALEDALRLALDRTPVEPGRRYKIVVKLRPVDEVPGYVGEGI